MDEFQDDKNFIISKIGYGIGNRDTDIPNVLRVMLVEEADKSIIHKNKLEQVYNAQCNNETDQQIIECNIDAGRRELFV